MHVAAAFTRLFIFLLSLFFFTLYSISGPGGYSAANALIGLGTGALFGALLLGIDALFRRFNLRSLNIVVIGLFVGYLLGQALILVLSAVLAISTASVQLSPQTLEIVQIALFLFGIYFGTLMTLRSSDELSISIPFIRFSPEAQKKRDLLLDASALTDPRLIDFTASGLLDNHLIIPRFLVKELYAQLESPDEAARSRGKRGIEVIKKLEEQPGLALRFTETDFPEVKELASKIIRLGRLLDANILTADAGKIQSSAVEGVRLINLHALSNALKPLMQTGEQIRVKIQRYGKEPRQGVGYLEDGTMVVVNGGGSYIGETIDAIVLSVKHTSSGRIIFCNAPDHDERPSHTPQEEP